MPLPHEAPKGRATMAIRQYLKDDTAFDPHDIQAMSMALEDVCNALKLSKGNGRDHDRAVIATRIIDLARQGERSPTKLRDRVLQEARTAEEP
jgi:hypothetical protein